MMKTIFNTLIILLLISLGACNKSTAINPEQTFTMRLNETKTLVTQNGLLNIHIEDIKDSRCPPNLYCIWPGNLSIDIKILTSKREFTLISLGATTVVDLTDYPPLKQLTVIDVSYPANHLFGIKEYAVVHMRIE